MFTLNNNTLVLIFEKNSGFMNTALLTLIKKPFILLYMSHFRCIFIYIFKSSS